MIQGGRATASEATASHRIRTLGPQSEVAEAIQHLPGSQHSRSEDSETNGTTTAPAQESLVDQLTAVGPSFQAPDSYQQHSISSHGAAVLSGTVMPAQALATAAAMLWPGNDLHDTLRRLAVDVLAASTSAMGPCTSTLTLVTLHLHRAVHHLFDVAAAGPIARVLEAVQAHEALGCFAVVGAEDQPPPAGSPDVVLRLNRSCLEAYAQAIQGGVDRASLVQAQAMVSGTEEGLVSETKPAATDALGKGCMAQTVPSGLVSALGLQGMQYTLNHSIGAAAYGSAVPLLQQPDGLAAGMGGLNLNLQGLISTPVFGLSGLELQPQLIDRSRLTQQQLALGMGSRPSSGNLRAQQRGVDVLTVLGPLSLESRTDSTVQPPLRAAIPGRDAISVACRLLAQYVIDTRAPGPEEPNFTPDAALAACTSAESARSSAIGTALTSPLTELGTYLARAAPNLYASQRSNVHQTPPGIVRLPRVGAVVGALPRIFEMTPTQHNSEYVVRLRIENVPGIQLQGKGGGRCHGAGTNVRPDSGVSNFLDGTELSASGAAGAVAVGSSGCLIGLSGLSSASAIRPLLLTMDPLEGTAGSHPYPLRPGVQDCAYYMRTGACRYGRKCCWHHPPERMAQLPLRSGSRNLDEAAIRMSLVMPTQRGGSGLRQSPGLQALQPMRLPSPAGTPFNNPNISGGVTSWVNMQPANMHVQSAPGAFVLRDPSGVQLRTASAAMQPLYNVSVVASEAMLLQAGYPARCNSLGGHHVGVDMGGVQTPQWFSDTVASLGNIGLTADANAQMLRAAAVPQPRPFSAESAWRPQSTMFNMASISASLPVFAPSLAAVVAEVQGDQQGLLTTPSAVAGSSPSGSNASSILAGQAGSKRNSSRHIAGTCNSVLQQGGDTNGDQGSDEQTTVALVAVAYSAEHVHLVEHVTASPCIGIRLPSDFSGALTLCEMVAAAAPGNAEMQAQLIAASANACSIAVCAPAVGSAGGRRVGATVYVVACAPLLLRSLGPFLEDEGMTKLVQGASPEVLQAFVQAVGAVPKALRSVAAQAPQASLSGLMGLAAGAATGPRVMRASHEASVHELQGLAADVASLPQIWHQQQLG